MPLEKAEGVARRSGNGGAHHALQGSWASVERILPTADQRRVGENFVFSPSNAGRRTLQTNLTWSPQSEKRRRLFFCSRRCRRKVGDHPIRRSITPCLKHVFRPHVPHHSNFRSVTAGPSLPVRRRAIMPACRGMLSRYTDCDCTRPKSTSGQGKRRE